MSIFDEIAKLIPEEIIGGVKLSPTVQHVDLDVEFTPVVEYCQFDDQRVLHDHRAIPKPLDIRKDASGYSIPLVRKLTEEQVKEMRCRFLLIRDHLYRNIRRLSPECRDKAIAWYFPGGVYVPREGSELSIAMGLDETKDN